MKKVSRKRLIFILIISLGLNLYHFIHDKQQKRIEVGIDVEKFLFNLNETARLLKEFEEEEITKKYETEGGKNEHLLWDASNYMSENEGRLNAYISEVPENLVSWNGGVFVDIRNKIKQNGEEESNQVLKDILNFKKGYDAEAGSINVYKEPYKALAIMEDVLSSKKYMGNRFIYKDR